MRRSGAEVTLRKRTRGSEAAQHCGAALVSGPAVELAMAANETTTFHASNNGARDGSGSPLGADHLENTSGVYGMNFVSSSHSLTNLNDIKHARLVNATSIDSESRSFSQSENLELRKRLVKGQDLDGSGDPQFASQNREEMEVPETKKRPSWLILALASGAFAALNGAFAKLYVLPFEKRRTTRPRTYLTSKSPSLDPDSTLSPITNQPLSLEQPPP